MMKNPSALTLSMFIFSCWQNSDPSLSQPPPLLSAALSLSLRNFSTYMNVTRIISAMFSNPERISRRAWRCWPMIPALLRWLRATSWPESLFNFSFNRHGFRELKRNVYYRNIPLTSRGPSSIWKIGYHWAPWKLYACETATVVNIYDSQWI